MNAIILCGGLSTRLGDITKTIPKILLRVGNKTVLDLQLEKIKKAGIDTVVMAAGHLSDVLMHEVGTERNGVKIVYAVEKEKLGTGGAIKFALSFVENQDEPTFVLNGDILTTVSLKELESALNMGKSGVILGSLVEDSASYGTLIYDEKCNLLEFQEKKGEHVPGYINGGFYLFTPEVKRFFPKEHSFSIEYDVFPKMKNLLVFPSDKPWIDIGVPERLAWAREHAEMFYA